MILFYDTGTQPDDSSPEALEEALGTAFHRQELDNGQCDHCKSQVKLGNIISIKAHCHPESDLVLWYVSGILLVTCATCENYIGKFAIADRDEIWIDPNEHD